MDKHIQYSPKRWLTISVKEAQDRGWDSLDVVLFSGDAYVDHPAFGAAVIGRLLENLGLKVAIVPQPNWQDDLRDFKKFGKPGLFFAVTSGCMDSMVNHYTAARRRRSDDAYTPGGEKGKRPDYATTVYSKILKQLYPDTPVIIGGIEASLRRVTHYDYWSDKLMPSILSTSQADLLVYGMGEQSLMKIVRLLRKGVPFSGLTTIPQTAILRPVDQELPINKNWKTKELVGHTPCLKSPKDFARNFQTIERESNKQFARRLIQEQPENKILLVNPPWQTMTEGEIDKSFDLPYTRMPHPRYSKRGPIPAYEMIKFSVNLHRGCFGGCSFCTISAHQGKMIASRSEKSILREVSEFTKLPGFKGVISDLGGPSANMYGMKGKEQALCDRCSAPSCIHPTICHNLDVDHSRMTNLYRQVQKTPGIRKAFVSSGIRYDMFYPAVKRLDRQNLKAKGLQMRPDGREYAEQLIRHHVSGRLKVAPEHSADDTLHIMRKPSFKFFQAFKDFFDKENQKAGKKQQIIPYFISGHPGCSTSDMAQLAADTKDMGFRLEQVQDFTPTPMTVATVIHYSGYHPYTLKKVSRFRSPGEKAGQKRFFFWYKPENRNWIRAQLKKIGRPDLISKLLPRKR